MSHRFMPLAVIFALLLCACESEPNPSSAPAGSRKSLKDTIKQEASKVAEAAREGAATVAESAKEVAHVAKEEALEIAAAARDLARSTKDHAIAVAQQKFDEARSQLEVLKEQKDRVKEQLRPEYERAVAELSERVDRLKSTVGELREAAPEAWRKTVDELAPLVVEVRSKVDSAWGAYVHGGRVHGSVTYLERMLLPESARMRVRLLDVSGSDAKAEAIAEHSTPVTGAPPFTFDLRFDPTKVDSRGAYAVEAEILIDGKRHFATPEPKRVSIGDAAATVEVLVKRAE